MGSTRHKSQRLISVVQHILPSNGANLVDATGIDITSAAVREGDPDHQRA